MVAGDGEHGGEGQLGVGVGRDVADGGVGEELHDHAHLLRDGREHHRALHREETERRIKTIIQITKVEWITKSVS